jgi:hypothetical protein
MVKQPDKASIELPAASWQTASPAAHLLRSTSKLLLLLYSLWQNSLVHRQHSNLC